MSDPFIIPDPNIEVEGFRGGVPDAPVSDLRYILVLHIDFTLTSIIGEVMRPLEQWCMRKADCIRNCNLNPLFVVKLFRYRVHFIMVL